MEVQTSPSAHKHFIDESTAEGQIRQEIEDLAEAILEKDVDRILLYYSSDAVIYDAQEGLESDKQALRKKWQDWLRDMDQINYDFGEVTVQAEGNLGFCHSLNHVTGTTKSGLKIDNWVQATTCFLRLDDEWKIVHQHVSTPVT